MAELSSQHVGAVRNFGQRSCAAQHLSTACWCYLLTQRDRRQTVSKVRPNCFQQAMQQQRPIVPARISSMHPEGPSTQIGSRSRNTIPIIFWTLHHGSLVLGPLGGTLQRHARRPKRLSVSKLLQCSTHKYASSCYGWSSSLVSSIEPFNILRLSFKVQEWKLLQALTIRTHWASE